MESLCQRMLNELDTDRSMKHIEWLTEHTPHRISGTGQDRTAAEYIRRELESYGCDEAEILEFETYNSRPGTSEFTLTAPKRMKMESRPCCHIEATPPGGAVYDLVYVGAGAEEDYAGKDVQGKAVLVEVSYAPATPEKGMIAYDHGAAAMICMNWGMKDKEVICMRGLKGVWGNPTPESYCKIPRITGCSITRKDGEYLRDLCKSGERVRIELKVTAERLWETLPQPMGVVRGKEEPEKFLLVSAHLDAWDPGVTCNATGDGTQLELARVFAKFKGELKRSVYFLFWNGHEIAEAAGSTWFADNYWDDLSENCIGYINIDSTGMKEATDYEVDASRELCGFAADCIQYALGEKVLPRPLGKIGDQSFFGLGIPSIFGRVGFTKELIEQNHGATLGWWNHTVSDDLDKVDRENLGKDDRAQLVCLLGMINSDILPYDFTETARDIEQKLGGLQTFAEGIVDLSILREQAGLLCGNIEKLNRLAAQHKGEGGDPAFQKRINKILLKLSRTLTGPFYSACSRYSQDSYGLSVLAKPIPLLYPIAAMSRMEKTSLEYRLLLTQMLRNRNMLTDALRNANEYIASLY